MTVGPLELIVLGFEGNNFRGEIAPAIEDAVNTGAIRIVDLVFVRKDASGDVTALEVGETNQEFARDFQGLSSDLRDLLTEDEAMTIAAMLPPNTSALVALFEHTWATHIAEAVRNAGGRLLASQRINPRLVDEVRDQIDEIMASEPARHS
jgi:hypothetical protein